MDRQPKSRPVMVYWKARVTRRNKAQYWAKTKSLSRHAIHFEISEYLKEGEQVKLEVFALNEGERHVIRLVGTVRTAVLLSCGTAFGIQLLFDRVAPDSQAFIERYLQGREQLKLHF